LDLGSNGLRLATSLGVRSFLGMGFALGLVTAAKRPGQGFHGVMSASRV